MDVTLEKLLGHSRLVNPCWTDRAVGYITQQCFLGTECLALRTEG